MPTQVRRRSAFAENLCKLMDDTGTTQQQLSEKIGTTRQTISQYMNGDIEPKMKSFLAIAKHFDVSCDFLLGRTRAAAPDDFIQEVVTRYGLSEQALLLLERLNAPLGIDDVEKDRITMTVRVDELAEILKAAVGNLKGKSKRARYR